MNDPGRMGMHHWAGFDASRLKDCLKDHPAMKLMDMVAERDAAFAQRDTAMAEKKTAFVERDAALLQRDLAYADRNAAWMERDATLAALAMIRVGKENNEAAAKLMQMVSGGGPVLFMDANSQGVPSGTAVALGKKQGKKRKSKSVAAACQTPKESKSPTKRKRKQKALQDVMEKDSQEESVNKASDVMVPFFPSCIPHPYCSCTGSNQQCYRWGKGGWQSACCTNFLSMYPLPMSPSKRSSRIPGRKMSGGAFSKLLERLSVQGLDISTPVDLKNYWAKHGTNRYITIK